MRSVLRIFVILTILLSAGCSKDLPTSRTDYIDVEWLYADSVVVGSTITARITSDTKDIECSWMVNNTIVSTATLLNYNVDKQGIVNIKVMAKNDKYTIEKEYNLWAIRGVTKNSSKWIDKILEYVPAPGQFINQSLGSPQGVNSIVSTKGLISLGGYGGYIVFGFDHSVKNIKDYDFVIHGNAFDNSSEPGAVMVAFDKNGNNIADDDEWFDIKGENNTDDKTVKDYSITYYRPSQTLYAENVRWTDNIQNNGFIKALSFHSQCYYPLFLEAKYDDSITFTGYKLDNTVTQDGELWSFNRVGRGYADNYSSEYPEMINGDRDTKNSNKFNIDDAVDKNGNKVNLRYIDFIKVYNCTNQSAPLIGECSTEVCGAISLSIL